MGISHWSMFSSWQYQALFQELFDSFWGKYVILIPSYTGNKTLVPSDQIFCKAKKPPTILTSSAIPPNHQKNQSKISMYGHTAKSLSYTFNQNQLVVLVNPSSSKLNDKGKWSIDLEGFTTTSYQRSITNPKPSTPSHLATQITIARLLFHNNPTKIQTLSILRLSWMS